MLGQGGNTGPAFTGINMMKQMGPKIKSFKLSVLRPAEYNPRTITADAELAMSEVEGAGII